MSVNENMASSAYHIGRLLAVLDKIQQDAIKSKSTITGRYWSAASTCPFTVFPHLIASSISHLEKQPMPYLQKMRDGIVSKIGEFPRRLTLMEQCEFCLGYFHQKNEIFRKRPKADSSVDGEQADAEEAQTTKEDF